MQSRYTRFLLSSALTCLAASTGWAQLPSYSQDFESLDQASPTALGDDGWLVGANVFDQGGNFIYNYFAFPAPNGGAAFSAVTNGWGGANQGAQALVVYNDYNNGDHSWANIEANFFREYITDASDVGRNMVFSFDGKLGDIQPPTTAAAFIKVLDPNNGWSVSEYQSVDTTNLTVNWETFTLSTEIRADQVGHIFQIGFMNTTTNWSPSGVGYDNINLDELVLGPDDCGGATAIAGDGVYPFDATGATTGAEGQNEALCLSYGYTTIENDIWFEWTAGSDGTVNVSTCDDANADTKIAAYAAGGCPTDGSALACNDDGPGCSGYTSSMDFACVAGTSYLIQVGHFPGTGGTTGNVTFTTTAPPTGPNPDNCYEPTLVAGDGVHAFDATSATTGAEGQNEALCTSYGYTAIDNDIWFEWTADTDGTVNVSTCDDANADTKIAAYPGGACPTDGSSLACNDDGPGCTGYTSSMDFACVAGTSYLIQVGHFPGTGGTTGNVTFTQTAAPTGPGTSYCAGDGSGTACPNGNAGGAGEGCANSTGSGAVLSASGSDSASTDDLVLSATNLPDNEPGLYFQGNNSVNGGAGITFGDGLRCAGYEARRLEIQTSAGGASATAGSIVTGGLVNVGDTKYYQLWYRDSSSSNAGFNTSNGLEITWTL